MQDQASETPSPESTSAAADAMGSPAAADQPTAPPTGGGDVVAELQRKLDEALAQAESYKDQALRRAADLENYKRRTDAEFASIVRTANENLLTALLPVLDDFVRSLTAGAERKDYEAFYRGVELIYQKLSRTLEKEGLVPFESTGKPFDVGYHDALLQVPRSDVPPHTVVQEVERGYMLTDRVLRHAKVIVSAEPTDTADGTPWDQGQDGGTPDA